MSTRKLLVVRVHKGDSVVVVGAGVVVVVVVVVLVVVVSGGKVNLCVVVGGGVVAVLKVSKMTVDGGVASTCVMRQSINSEPIHLGFFRYR